MRDPQSYVIEGARAMALRVRPAGRPGYVELALLSHGDRLNEPVVLPERECEHLAQALAMALFSGARGVQ
jgi:hypothetical protein